MRNVVPDRIDSTYTEHTRGVRLARSGQLEEALNVLLPLLQRFPEDYPLQRDVVLISAWKGGCPGALKRFERLRLHRDLEPYLVVSVTDCLLDANRPQEACRLERCTRERHPENESLKDAFLKADFVLRVDQNRDEERPAIETSSLNNSSDQGLSEWILRVEGSARVAETARFMPATVLLFQPNPKIGMAIWIE